MSSLIPLYSVYSTKISRPNFDRTPLWSPFLCHLTNSYAEISLYWKESQTELLCIVANKMSYLFPGFPGGPFASRQPPLLSPPVFRGYLSPRASLSASSPEIDPIALRTALPPTLYLSSGWAAGLLPCMANSNLLTVPEPPGTRRRLWDELRKKSISELSLVMDVLRGSPSGSQCIHPERERMAQSTGNITGSKRRRRRKLQKTWMAMSPSNISKQFHLGQLFLPDSL